MSELEESIEATKAILKNGFSFFPCFGMEDDEKIEEYKSKLDFILFVSINENVGLKDILRSFEICDDGSFRTISHKYTDDERYFTDTIKCLYETDNKLCIEKAIELLKQTPSNNNLGIAVLKKKL